MNNIHANFSQEVPPTHFENSVNFKKFCVHTLASMLEKVRGQKGKVVTPEVSLGNPPCLGWSFGGTQAKRDTGQTLLEVRKQGINSPTKRTDFLK